MSFHQRLLLEFAWSILFLQRNYQIEDTRTSERVQPSIFERAGAYRHHGFSHGIDETKMSHACHEHPSQHYSESANFS
jgi:hypothetical protein